MASQTEDILSELVAKGVRVDVTQRLQVERVLALAGEGRSRAELKTLVTPILAGSDDEQVRIHEIFDAEPRVKPGGVGGRRGPGPDDTRPSGVPRWILAAAVALPVAAAGAAWWVTGPGQARKGDPGRDAPARTGTGSQAPAGLVAGNR